MVAALREHGLIERAAISTMEIPSIAEVRASLLQSFGRRLDDPPRHPRLGPGKSAGRDRACSPRWAYARRSRMPAGGCQARSGDGRLGGLGSSTPWSPRRLVEAAHGVGVSVIAWTVDELERAQRLAALGVDGICSNDPRLLADL